jgi:RHS repeat-associated protein
MFSISEDQLGAMRKRSMAAGLVESFRGQRQTASIGSGGGDVLLRDPNGAVMRAAFDAAGFIGRITSPRGRVWRLENDRQGRLVGLDSPDGSRLGLAYDKDGRLAELSREGQKVSDFTWRSNTKPLRIGYPDGSAYAFEYDGFDRPTLLGDRNGSSIGFGYDDIGRLTWIRDPNGRRTTFDYAGWDRPIAAHFPDKTSEQYEYSATGQLRRIVDAMGQFVDLEYDDAGHVVVARYDDGIVSLFRHDDASRLVEAREGESVVKFAYNDAGQIVEEDAGGERKIKYKYDAAGSLVEIELPGGERLGYRYDEDARLSGVSDWSAGETRLSYAADDRATTIRHSNGLTTYVALEAGSGRGLPREVRLVRDDTVDVRQLFSLKYQYDAEDRVVALADSGYGLRRYEYDREGRLLSARPEPPMQAAAAASSPQPWPTLSPPETFAYDAAGNRVRSGEAVAEYDAGDHCTRFGATKLAYDARGNLVDSAGPGGVWRFSYDGRNRLIRAENKLGQAVTFGYDALGRRSWKRFGERLTRYLWAGETLLSEEEHVGEKLVSRHDYLYYPGTHTPLAIRVDGVVYCCHNDHLGTPRRLTDPDGKIAWAANYSAFGEARVVGESSVSHPLRFVGQHYDSETGLHYNRFRYYAPALGRYLSRDPLSFIAGTNFYSYSGNDPVNYADPLGLAWWKTALSVVAAVAVGVAVVALAPVAAPLAIIAAGAAAGAVGFGLNEALNQDHFCLGCIAKEALRGAAIGAVAALPFAFLPATAGIGAFAAAGGGSGGISYLGDWLTNPGMKWDWADFGMAVGIGAATAGVARFLGPRVSRWWQSRKPSGVKYGTASDQHVIDHGHAADGQPPMVDKAASAKATKKTGQPTTVYKSKFAPGEGGQGFTDEVVNHPDTTKQVKPNGRTVYENDDLGRVTGTGQDGKPVRGGTVVQENATPHPKSSTPPNEVVTQFPSGNAAQGPPKTVAPGSVLPPPSDGNGQNQ